MTFFEDGDEIISTWEPKPQFEGYHGVLHGGIQATIMDEIASWVVYVKVKVAGVTSSMNIHYHKPIYMTGGAYHCSFKNSPHEKKPCRHTGYDL